MCQHYDCVQARVVLNRCAVSARSVGEAARAKMMSYVFLKDCLRYPRMNETKKQKVMIDSM